MMRRVPLAVLMMLTLSLSAWMAQGARAKAAPGQAGLSHLLSGRSIPLSLKMKDLNGSWRRFTALGADAVTGAYSAMYGLPGNVYYTQGRTVSAQGETYLIAYAPQMKAGSIQMLMMGRGPAPEKVTGETAVQLALLNLRTMGSLGDVRAFNLKAELDSFNAAVTAMQSMATARTAPEEGEAEEMGDESLSNLKNIAMAMQMYIVDYDAAPAMDTPEAFAAALDEYVPNAGVFNDPDTGEYYPINSFLSGKPISALTSQANTVLVYQAKPGKDGRRGVGFVDGHVKKVTEEEWQKLKTASGIQ